MMAYKHSGWLHVLFYLGLALLTCHELDAVARSEWRLLPFLKHLNDTNGQIVFVLIHIPAFVLLFWSTGHQSNKIRFVSQLAIDCFLVIHGALHYLLSGHSLYEFEAPVETITVYGGAVIGLLHGVLLFKAKRSE